MNNGFSSVMESLLKGVDSILSTKTVVGEPKQFGDTIILPLVDVTFGVGAGGSAAEKKDGAGGGLTFSSKKAEKDMLDDDEAKEIAFGDEKED